MGEVYGFLKFARRGPERRPVPERVRDWLEIYCEWPEADVRQQAARCMDCGIPFCSSACPLDNVCPDWNYLSYAGDWGAAAERLHATNNFPEFTGRLCPALCEASCSLSVNGDPVTISAIEQTIVERAWSEGWIRAQAPEVRTGKRVAVIGSGPSGLACAQQLNRSGHSVTVFEKNEYVGGLLSLGIPDFKLEKHIVQRRVRLLEEEGIVFRTGTAVGTDVSTAQLREDFDAICLCGGSSVPRDLPVPGRELAGIHFAMDYLTQQNRRNAGQDVPPDELITAEGKNVVIIGGGDTGADCLGTAVRQGAKSIRQFELLPEPPLERPPGNPWPQWPAVLRTASAHEEYGEREFSITAERFDGADGRVSSLTAVRVDWQPSPNGGGPQMSHIDGSQVTIETEFVLLAMGFLHGAHEGLLTDLGVEFDERGNVRTDGSMMTTVDGVFAGGDVQRGQSLVVHAIAGGRAAAAGCNAWLAAT